MRKNSSDSAVAPWLNPVVRKSARVMQPQFSARKEVLSLLESAEVLSPQL